jgi:hypothetical protein
MPVNQPFTIQPFKTMPTKVKISLDGDVRLFDITDRAPGASGSVADLTAEALARFKLTQLPSEAATLVWTDEDGDRITIDNDATMEEWLSCPKGSKPRCELITITGVVAHAPKPNQPEVDMFVCASSSLFSGHGLSIPPAELKSLAGALNVLPQRLAKSGLIPDYLVPSQPYAADDAEAEDEADGDAFGEDEGDSGGISDAAPSSDGVKGSLVLAVLCARGVTTTPAQTVAKVLVALKIAPKRFVRLGLVQRNELRLVRAFYRRHSPRGRTVGDQIRMHVAKHFHGPPHHGPPNHGPHHGPPPPPFFHGLHRFPHPREMFNRGNGGGGQRHRMAAVVTGNSEGDVVIGAPNSHQVKTWTVTNKTGRAWPPGTQLLLLPLDVSGHVHASWPKATPLDDKDRAVPSSGGRATVSVTVQCPTEPGVEESACFQLAGPRGGRFGETLICTVRSESTGMPPEDIKDKDWDKDFDMVGCDETKDTPAVADTSAAADASA